MNTEIIDGLTIVQGSRSLDLYPNDKFLLRALNLGDPSNREVTRPQVGRHGLVDETQFMGERGVSIGLRILEKPFARVLDELNAFRDPGYRSELRLRMPGRDERILIVRPDQFSSPIGMDSRITLDWMGQWKAPDPRFYSMDVNRTLLFPGETEPGRDYDLTFDRDYPFSEGVGVMEVNNRGNVGVYPVIRIFGPCTNPKIANETSGKVLHFDDLTIADGDYLDIRPLSRTIRLNSLPEQNRYRHLNTSISEWFLIRPGKQDIRFYPSTASEPSVAEISFRSAWI